MEAMLAVIAVMGLLIAIPQFWGSNWLELFRYHWQGRVPWTEVHSAYVSVADQVLRAEFRPDVVVGVGRGGIVAAGLVTSEIMSRERARAKTSTLSEFSNPKPIRLISLNSRPVYREGSAREIERIELAAPSKEIAEGNRILVILAQTFTGRSLDSARKSIQDLEVSPNKIRTATLFLHKKRGVVPIPVPEFVGSEINASKTMPWKKKTGSTDRF